MSMHARLFAWLVCVEMDETNRGVDDLILPRDGYDPAKDDMEESPNTMSFYHNDYYKHERMTGYEDGYMRYSGYGGG